MLASTDTEMAIAIANVRKAQRAIAQMVASSQVLLMEDVCLMNGLNKYLISANSELRRDYWRGVQRILGGGK